MTVLVSEVVKTLRRRGLLPDVSAGGPMPLPAINKVELYPTFHCDDCCAHCITKSGPDREETLTPDDASKVVRHIATFSIITGLKKLFGGGEFRCEPAQECRHLESLEKPPERLEDPLKEAYSRCLQGRDCKCWWVRGSSLVPLNFTRPSVRISGGEFFTWPCNIDGKELAVDERLHFQSRLIRELREALPDYDVWILTNGRFAVTQQEADRVIERWAENANLPAAAGKTRICISVDVFHQSPPGSSVEQMLERIWSAARRCALGAPFVYGIPNNRIGYLGRALRRLKPGRLEKDDLPPRATESPFNPVTSILVDPIDLMATGGCRELQGFIFNHPTGSLIANNVVIAPNGHLVYCCACLGDYGDFVRDARAALARVVDDPVSVMLRRGDTAATLLALAAESDPSIAVLGSGRYPAATGSTCYQMMTGERPSPRHSGTRGTKSRSSGS